MWFVIALLGCSVAEAFTENDILQKFAEYDNAIALLSIRDSAQQQLIEQQSSELRQLKLKLAEHDRRYAEFESRYGILLPRSLELDATMTKRQHVPFLPEIAVAFSALKSANLGNVNAGNNIVFDLARVNEGQAYNSGTGVFTAPYGGLYFFTVTLEHQNQPQPVHGQIVHNGNVVARIHCESSEFEMSSQSVVLSLFKGDQVSVRVADYSNEEFATELHSSFSGFILWQV